MYLCDHGRPAYSCIACSPPGGGDNEPTPTDRRPLTTLTDKVENKPRITAAELLKACNQLGETQLWLTNLARRMIDKDDPLDSRACSQIAKELGDHAGHLTRIAHFF